MRTTFDAWIYFRLLVCSFDVPRRLRAALLLLDFDDDSSEQLRTLLLRYCMIAEHGAVGHLWQTFGHTW